MLICFIQEFEGDCSEFCSVQVKVEDSELKLEPAYTTQENEDESYEVSFPEFQTLEY